ncbi:MAG TPA: 2-oxoacid:acceptor oxidoreductase family protein [Candidatus Omnitrophota bacterium]|nr:2-oxoacid:acceptor oxidoreductase family protein [Candidatus Omnitrophota bacterium]HRY85373.1 2-oxoacid:acceptor oxidoreductase family protein [Candidatus Omnitrophota bacterium]
MIEEKIFVAGFGGQGVVVAGNVLAHAALEEGRYILGMVSYGVEVRGGASHSFVIISDQEIDCPIIDEATLGFALSQAAYEKFKTKTRPDGIFFIDSSQVSNIDPAQTTGRIIEIPATQIAREVGNEKVTNMIMLGAAIQKTGIVKMASAVKILGKVFKGLRKDLIYVNEKALQVGADFMRQKR